MKLFKKSVKVASLCMLVSSSVALAAGADTTLMLTQHDGENYLTWSTDVASVVRQELYRSDTDSLSDAERISVVPASDLVIEDENAGEFTDYRYWVKVIDNNGKEHVSNMASTISEENLLSTAGSSRCVAGATFKNETVDCGGATIGLKCDGDSESQPAVLTLENAKVKNVRISKSGGSDGIHCKSGNCTIENAVWEDICEDAATLTKTAKSLTIIGGTAYNSTSGPGGKPDKVFQHNAKNGTTTVISGVHFNRRTRQTMAFMW
ncbi:pectate lyase [Vibrio sp. PP-XX7]